MITLKTLPTATEQEVFDQVAEHLLTQNRRSQTSNDDPQKMWETPKVCVYRAPGLKCAAGCLIDDSEYFPEMEGRNWFGLVMDKVVPEEHRVLIHELQRVHDSKAPELWQLSLRRLAETRQLSTKVLDRDYSQDITRGN